METKVKLKDKFKKLNILNKINVAILLTTIAAMITWIIIMYINLGVNGVNEDITKTIWGDVIVIPIMAFAALAGVISVVAANNKSPMTLLVFSSIATIYKLMYAVIQLITGQEMINSSVLIGQSVSFFTLMIQVYFWIRWNKETDEGKFITQAFKGWRTLFAVSLIVIIFTTQVILSYNLNKGNVFGIILDVSGAMLYTTASILMAFGNIFCFLFFFLSDINWLWWTILDISTSDNLLMTAMAITTLIEVISYTFLAFTGFFQWFSDDFEFEDREYKNFNLKVIVRKDRIKE